jgi:hypothetical protein
MTVFDTGNALLSFYADDIAQTIRILDITAASCSQISVIRPLDVARRGPA